MVAAGVLVARVRLCLKAGDRYTARMRYLIGALLALPGVAFAAALNLSCRRSRDGA